MITLFIMINRLTNNLYISIAGFNIHIRFRNTKWRELKQRFQREIIDLLKGLILSQNPLNIDYYIDFIWENDVNIIYHKKDGVNFLNYFKNIKHNKIVCYYRISSYEFKILINYILFDLLAKNKGFILHASAIHMNGVGIAFIGNSGAGKTTISSLLKNPYEIIADDAVIVRKLKSNYYLYQMPFFGTNELIRKTNDLYMIKAIFFLNKSESNSYVNLFNKNLIARKLIKSLLINSRRYIKLYNNTIINFVTEYSKFYDLYFIKNKESVMDVIINLL